MNFGLDVMMLQVCMLATARCICLFADFIISMDSYELSDDLLRWKVLLREHTPRSAIYSHNPRAWPQIYYCSDS